MAANSPGVDADSIPERNLQEKEISGARFLVGRQDTGEVKADSDQVS
jgi:hypothetical protein